MERAKAIALVYSIIEVHREALRETHPRCVQVLDNAESDLKQLVLQIYADFDDGDPGNDGNTDHIKLSQPE